LSDLYEFMYTSFSYCFTCTVAYNINMLIPILRMMTFVIPDLWPLITTKCAVIKKVTSDYNNEIQHQHYNLLECCPATQADVIVHIYFLMLINMYCCL
jgi:hypothetical protein